MKRRLQVFTSLTNDEDERFRAFMESFNEKMKAKVDTVSLSSQSNSNSNCLSISCVVHTISARIETQQNLDKCHQSHHLSCQDPCWLARWVGQDCTNRGNQGENGSKVPHPRAAWPGRIREERPWVPHKRPVAECKGTLGVWQGDQEDGALFATPFAGG